MEVILAMSLATVILVILLAAMRLAYKAQESGVSKAEETQRLRIINDRISWLIRGVYPFRVTRPEMNRVAFEGSEEGIGFVTTSIDGYSTGPEDSAGLKWVSLSADDRGLVVREKVFFLNDLVDEGNGKEYVLDPDVKRLQLQYYDVKPEQAEKEEKGEWVAQWDTQEKPYLPAAVKVRISLGRGEETLPMPEMIVRLNVLTSVQ